MTSDVLNRSVLRKQFADLLREALVGTDKPVAAVYEYQRGDFRGRSPVVIVTGSSSERSNPVTTDDGAMYLDVHTFVEYARAPLTLAVDIEPDQDVVIEFTDTSMFQVGTVVTLEDDLGDEEATVSEVVDETHIVLDEVVGTYATPFLHYWTESQSEDLIDLLEKMIGDVIVDANTVAGTWLSCAQSDRSEIDVVEIGGDPYRHEMITVRFVIQDFE